MAAAEPPEPPRDPQLFLTVFQGSSPEDVSHARRFWSSVSLLPPLESRLVSADIRQRLPVSRPAPRGCSAERRPPPAPGAPGAPLGHREERRRYEAMADQRKEILALLARQRERRVRREQPGEAVRATRRRRGEEEEEQEEQEQEEDMVRQLQ